MSSPEDSELGKGSQLVQKQLGPDVVQRTMALLLKEKQNAFVIFKNQLRTKYTVTH